MNSTKRCIALAALLFGTAETVAQYKGSGSGSGTGTAATPYSGFDKRQVASFSDAEVAAMLDGRGMGFALSAEINGYPGPAHILELADQLGLTTVQREVIRQRFEFMQVRAREAATRYVAAEKALDQAFRENVMDLVAIKRLTVEADNMRSETRFAHLQAHVEARRILAKDQLERYATLRGYGTKAQ